MNCQCQGIEELFNQEQVDKDLRQYRRRGPDRTTRWLVDAIRRQAAGSRTLLDIGGGVGAIQHALLEAGVERAEGVDASAAYCTAAVKEAQRRGLGERVSYHYGNFTDLAEEVAPADIVTLDRVICCYDDMEQLVALSVRKARQIYGVVYPRDGWWMNLGAGLMNLYFRIRRSPYRGFVHPTRAVEAIIHQHGYQQQFYRRTLIWQVAVYTRPA
jgi:hypothetical protein